MCPFFFLLFAECKSVKKYNNMLASHLTVKIIMEHARTKKNQHFCILFDLSSVKIDFSFVGECRGVYRKSVLSAQIFCKPKTALKIKIY